MDIPKDFIDEMHRTATSDLLKGFVNVLSDPDMSRIRNFLYQAKYDNEQTLKLVISFEKRKNTQYIQLKNYIIENDTIISDLGKAIYSNNSRDVKSKFASLVQHDNLIRIELKRNKIHNSGFIEKTGTFFRNAAKIGLIAAMLGTAAPSMAKTNTMPANNPRGTELSASVAAVQQKIIQNASQYVGKKIYRFGAAGPDYFDCSSFVRHIYSLNGIDLSRTSKTQSREGTIIMKKRLDINKLQPGDLVFFLRGPRLGHVGIYAGNGMMIHALNGKIGIIASDLNNPYWRARFVKATRVIEPPENPTASIQASNVNGS